MFKIPLQEPTLKKYLSPAIWLFAALSLVAVVVLLIHRSTTANINTSQQVSHKVDWGDVSQIVHAYGKLVSSQNSVVLASIDGVIKQIQTLPGAYVELGDSILQLDNPKLLQRLEELKLEKLEADANLSNAEAQLRRDILKAEVAKDEAALDLELATKTLAMRKELYDQKIISRLEYLQSDSNFSKAKLRSQQARRGLQEFEQSGDSQLRAFKLRVSGAQTRVVNIQKNISDLTVRADTEGVITSLEDPIEVGALVNIGQIIARLANPNSLVAEVYVSANDAGRIVLGQLTRITIAGETIDGELTSIDPTVTDGQVRTEIKLLDALPAGVRENMDVTATIQLQQVEGVVRIPKFRQGLKAHSSLEILVETKDGDENRIVEMGLVGNDYVEILNGLSPGERFYFIPAN